MVRNCVQSAYCILKGLKGMQHGLRTAVDIIVMMLPLASGVGFGCCPLTPGGVGVINKVIVPSEVARLSQKLKDSVTYDKMKEGSKLTRNKMEALRKKKRRPRSKRRWPRGGGRFLPQMRRPPQAPPRRRLSRHPRESY